MPIVLIRYSEIGLKSTPVRTRFENQLKGKIISMLASENIEALVTKGDARFYVESNDIEGTIHSLKKVFGVASISVAERCTSDMDDICAKAAEYSLSRISENQSFAVKARREGNQTYTSMDVGKQAGSAIFEANKDKNVKVDLKNPDVKIYIEVRNKKAYIFDSYIQCHAGLPLGSQGAVLAEVNDDRGILSAWLMMKRGCKVFIRGDADISLLKKYDRKIRPLNKYPNDPKSILGYVKGTSIREIKQIDPSKYELPIFFPTIGMTDADVRNYLDKLVAECE